MDDREKHNLIIKKLILGSLTALMLVGLLACGGGAQTPPPAPGHFILTR